MSAVSPGKLPFWPTVQTSFALTIQHASVFFGYAWPFLAALFIIDAVSAWVHFPLAMKMRSDPKMVSVTEYLSLGNIAMIANLLVGAVLAVAWHRYIVGRIEPTASRAIEQGRRVAAYLAWGLAGIVPVWLAMIPTMSLALVFDEEPPWPVIAALVGLFLGALTPFFRYVLIFPAAALGHAVKLRSISYATQGNAVRLACGTYVASVPAFAAGILLDPAQVEQRDAYAALFAASDFSYMVTGMPIVTFLSLAYLHFAEAIRDAAARDDEIASGTGG